MPRALIFDLDDTLYPERRFHLSGLAAVAVEVHRRTGSRASDAFRHMRLVARSQGRAFVFQSLCDAFGLDYDLVPLLVVHYRAHQPRLRLPRSTAHTLAAARPGWRTAVVTNGVPEVQRRKVAALGIAAFVDEVVVASEWGSGAGKPEPHGFLRALGVLGVSPGDAVFVGDDPACDVRGARAVGLATIQTLAYADRGGASVEADAVVDSLSVVPHVAARLLEERCIHGL
jgi:putative hydrolase of the HAD superfamily